MARLGLLAGVGTLPFEFVQTAKKQGHEIVCIAVVPDVDTRLRSYSDEYFEINVFKLNKILRTFWKANVKEVTMLGKVTKEYLYKRKLVIPDLRTVKLLNKLRKLDFKDDTIMLALVDELEGGGLKVMDQTKYLKPLMPPPQIFTHAMPSEEQMDDIAFGFKTAKLIGQMDIGQTVVVKDKAVMAVEAIEGTDACIRRGGKLAGKGAVVVKVAKPNQDPRFDVPAVGLDTLNAMIETKCKVLAIEAEKTLFVDRFDVMDKADQHDIVIVSVNQESL
ncbi:MAG: UDP-2,3-diacylglucosamine diphosphatase LpxI [Dialister micraerophilus]|uniref:LpxI family protein n=1 Tax=Dialister micraerophilus TaxID=309120 RepID=UPI002550DAD6|nr:UDP-2,3-diacylglucosamine diphosphatase LpxI [Dialister micraerophilus]MDK8253029.1 UDP-2,3-diacylglucosamine diphosphatase LpxI [Dialister micraerophilus]